MSLRTPKQHVEKLASVAAEYAEALGFVAIPQFFAFDASQGEDGREYVVVRGPLRYTPEMAQRDAKQSPGKAAIAVIARTFDPSDPEDASAYYAYHQRLAIEERGELGGGK